MLRLQSWSSANCSPVALWLYTTWLPRCRKTCLGTLRRGRRASAEAFLPTSGTLRKDTCLLLGTSGRISSSGPASRLRMPSPGPCKKVGEPLSLLVSRSAAHAGSRKGGSRRDKVVHSISAVHKRIVVLGARLGVPWGTSCAVFTTTSSAVLRASYARRS